MKKNSKQYFSMAIRRVMIFNLILFTYSLVHGQEKLSPETLWKFKRLSDVRVSPDGKSMIYGISSYDLGSNSGNRNIYLSSLENNKHEQLTNMEGSEFNAIWRPDGKKIAYINSRLELWEMNPDGSEKRKVQGLDQKIRGFAYAPDMEHVLLLIRVKLNPTAREIYPDLPKSDVRIIDDLMYRHWDSWDDYAYNHIFIAGYNDGNISGLKDIMPEEPYHAPDEPWGGMEEICWHPDGSKIAYACKKLKGKEYTLSTNTDIYEYDLKTGETINLSIGMPGYDRAPLYAPDGKSILWQSMETPAYEADKERLIIHYFSSGRTKDLSKEFDQNTGHYIWDKKGKSIYFISAIHGCEQIYNLIPGKKPVQITKGMHNYTSLALAADVLIAEKMSMSQPTELYKVNPEDGTETQITFYNKTILETLEMGRVEERWIKTTDNKDMLVWVIYPPAFDPQKKYPAILYCQGGPQSAVSQFFSYRWNFQIMAAHDYIVVAPNRRGLPGFGTEWNRQISEDYGGQNMKDYLSAIDALAKEDYIDEDRLGAVGASYGGFSVYWLAGHHENRFKAFISHCGMFNFESWYGTTEELWFGNFDLGGPYWDKPRPQSYEFSPHLFVDQWNTPILIITGGLDFRVPFTESVQAFQAAQLRNIPSRFLYFPNESHFILEPQNAVLWQREFFKWLDQWLKD
jgi:dipeptidyl aminopeptidase/acylaminoacyl peptidase